MTGRFGGCARSQTHRELTIEDVAGLVRRWLGPDGQVVRARELGGGGFAAVGLDAQEHAEDRAGRIRRLGDVLADVADLTPAADGPEPARGQHP